jgi:hypothetical protein
MVTDNLTVRLNHTRPLFSAALQLFSPVHIRCKGAGGDWLAHLNTDCGKVDIHQRCEVRHGIQQEHCTEPGLPESADPPVLTITQLSNSLLKKSHQP